MTDQHTAHKIFKNTLGQIIFRVLDIGFGVIILGLITRYLGQEGYGYYTTAAAFLQLFLIVIDFGLYLTLLREISVCAESEIEKITNRFLTLRVISSAGFIILACAAIFVIPYNATVQWGVVILSVGYFFSSLISTATALFQKYLRMVYVAGMTATVRIITFVLTLAVIANHGGIYLIFWVNSLGTVIGYLIIHHGLRSLPTPIHFRFRFNGAYTRVILKKSWPIAVTIALNLVYLRADTVMLSIYQSPQSVGLYGAAYRVIDIITVFPHMFMGLLLPLLTAAWMNGQRDKIRAIWERAFMFFAILAIPMVGGTLVIGRSLMTLVAGSNFALSGDILKILIIATAAIFFGVLYTYLILVIDKQREMIKYFAITAIVSVAGYFIFIPRFSYWGAAWMTVVSEVMVAVSAWFLASRSISLPLPWKKISKCIASTIVMMLLANVLQTQLPILVVIIISGLVYGALCIATQVVTVRDIKQLIRPA